MNLADKYPKMSNLLKKLALAEVYIVESNNQVTLDSICKIVLVLS